MHINVKYQENYFRIGSKKVRLNGKLENLPKLYKNPFSNVLRRDKNPLGSKVPHFPIPLFDLWRNEIYFLGFKVAVTRGGTYSLIKDRFFKFFSLSPIFILHSSLPQSNDYVERQYKQW